MATTTGTYKAECAVSHAVFEAGWRDGEDGSATMTYRAVSEEHPSWPDDSIRVYLNGAEDGARGDHFRLGLVCGLCGPVDDYTARPVVVGEVWEGVLENRVVRVTRISDGTVWFVDAADAMTSDDGKAWFGYSLPLAEFRERFTRRGTK